ncbi:STAS/SEC14 domain-containing protein [Desertivirga brevis]|uniref:STAS/SEC14 domain-containing protein n=1 Tax=Desertivirga brevis TaxID=2810310 RepID=UPI001A96B971|nr:STAS/SEC14 domain-containing protein [Pedobacter sp. SYSU D00873]
MVELLMDFPDHVAAYRAVGSVSKEEYESIVMSRVNEVAEKYGKLNFIVLLETDMDNYSIGAFLEYLKISFQHFSKWKRMAIVSDEKWLRTAYETLSLLVPGVIKSYPLSEFDKAKEWVSGPAEV